MQTIKIFITIALLLAVTACATTQRPSFAHVHVGHTLSAWPDTPSQTGLFSLSEELAVDIIEIAIAASELAKQGDYGAAVQAGSRIASIIGTLEYDISSPEQYTFLAAFDKSINHFKYSIESPDATPNLIQGLKEVVRKSDDIIARTNVLRELASLLSTLRKSSSIAQAVQQLREMAIQNLDGGDNKYSLREMRNELATILTNETPPYVAPGKKYLFGLTRLPNGDWFWNFKSADDDSTYGRYSY